jgi:leucine dehydrogenase
METKHVAGLIGCSGDPSPITARGVFRAIKASVRYSWGSDDLSGACVALQGCGHVGYYLAKHLHEAGARLIASDVDTEKVARVVEEFDAEQARPDEIYGVRADIFAPCALGGIINDSTIPQFQARVIAGAANNQLLEDRHGEMLAKKGILYAPDYAANAGGIIYGCIELLGWEPASALRKVDEIYQTILTIFELASREGIPTSRAADRLAENRLQPASESV